MSNNNVNAADHVTNNITCAQGVTSFRNKLGVTSSSHPTQAAINAANAAAQHCIAQYRQVLTYQPASRYWTFQTYETAIFLGIALIVAGFCFWWIRHRIT